MNSHDNVMRIVNEKLSNNRSKVHLCNQNRGVEKCMGEIINLYTKQDIYENVKAALRRQNISNYNPSDDDKKIGPYALILDSIFMYWTELKITSGETY